MSKTVTLFATEKQDQPREMLRDLTTLYMLHYGEGLAEAIRLMSLDLRALAIEMTARAKERQEAAARVEPTAYELYEQTDDERLRTVL